MSEDVSAPCEEACKEAAGELVNADFEGARRKLFEMFMNRRFFEVDVNCPVHGLQKMMVAEDAKGDVTCPECEKEREEQAAKQAKRAVHERSLERRGVAREFFGATVANYVPRSEGQKEARSCVRNLCEGKLKKVVLLGGNGVGKTHLACAAVKWLGGKRVTAYELGLRIRATYSRAAQETEQDVLDELARLPFLVIDELGRSKNSEAMKDWLSYIVDRRHSAGLPLMICSNAHMMTDCPKGGCDGCFEQLVGSDVLSRLQQDSQFVRIGDVKDFRRGA